ncbi:MAG: hypothetical protein WKF92_15290 [Pyrinomonadaceae bacterium]
MESVVENEVPQRETSDESGEKGTWQFTESVLIDEKRTSILRAIEKANEIKLVKKSRALYWSADRTIGIACTISKRYENKNFLYWYAYHPAWQEFLSKTTKGFFVLGCMDMNMAFAIPLQIIQARLIDLNTTTKNGKTYWHIQIQQMKGNSFRMQVHKSGKHLDLAPYMVNILANLQ